MGFFSSLGKLFTTKEKKVEEIQPSVDHLVGVRYSDAPKQSNYSFAALSEGNEKRGGVNAPPSGPKPDNPPPPQRPISNEVIQKPVYNKQEGVLPMAEKYLVVLDTTNRPEVKDRGLQGGLKNFYFVYATTPDQAREIVLRSFARSPQILNQIQYSITVTPLTKIIPLMDEKNFFWSYIPFKAGQRAPGQRATPPAQKTNPANPEEVIPMDPREIPIPITPERQNDTPKVSEIADEAKAPAANPMAAFMSPTLPNGQPNPMYAMMQMMTAAMQNGQVPQVPKGPPQPVITRGDPNSDPELAQRMAEVRASAVPRHKNHDPTALDENMEAAERAANQQVERFKSLPKEQQAAATLQKVDMNDVGVDMSHMRKIMEASQLNKE